MGKASPIKNIDDIDRLKNYYLERGKIRDYTLVTLALNLPIRLEQLLSLQWQDVFSDLAAEECREAIRISGKDNACLVAINREVRKTLLLYLRHLQLKKKVPTEDDYLFKSRVGDNRPIQRSAAYRIIAKGAKEIGLDGLVGFESMRKTIGYQAWKAGLSRTSIMAVYNHPSLKATREYLTIDDTDDEVVALDINL